MTYEKNLPLTQSRNYGVDLLRIVAMFMVLFLHILGNGGILFEIEPLSAHGITAWFFEMATFSAINCYGVISGFVGVNSKYKYTNLVMLYLQVALYCVGITLIYKLRYPLMVTSGDILSSFFPISTQKYWYVTAYTGMFLLMPLLNSGARSLTKKQFGATLAALFLALSVLPSIFNRDIFSTLWGYNTLWLCFLYLVGAYIKLYGIFSNSPKRSFAIYTVCVIFSWVVKLWEEYVSDAGKYADLAAGFVAQYTSPPMLIAGVALFVVFANMHIPKKLTGFIKWVSPCAFGVYILHAHPYIWDRVVFYRYATYINYNPLVMMLLVALTALVIFAIFAFADFIRIRIFNVLKIKPLLLKLEAKLTGGLWN